MKRIFPGIPHVESPLFCKIIDELDLNEDERRVAWELYERGYAVIDFPDPEIDARIDRIKSSLGPRFGIDFADPAAIKNTGEGKRIQDAWLTDEDVRAIAANPQVLALLEKLYGRRAFPFQTLNFPVGTQQHLHSDSIHFSCLPERFMCGVWLAMEDISADAGPLTYVPGSHKWPIISNIMIGRRAEGSQLQSAQDPFEEAWDAMIMASRSEQEVFLPRKGQALIWSANLLHGGSRQNDLTLTRWSQVSHYYFEDCIYYTPAHSDEPIGRLDLRTIMNVATSEIEPNRFLGQDLSAAQELNENRSGSMVQWPWRAKRKSANATPAVNLDDLPIDFEPAAYLQLNPDVEAAKIDPAEHYVRYGMHERRQYRAG